MSADLTCAQKNLNSSKVVGLDLEPGVGGWGHPGWGVHSGVVGLTLMGFYGWWKILPSVFRTSLTSYKVVRIVGPRMEPREGV